MEKWQKARPTTKRKQGNSYQLNHPNTQYNNYQQYPQQTVENFQQQGQRSSQNDLILTGKEQQRLCNFIWATLIWEAIGFNSIFFGFFIVSISNQLNIWTILWIIHGLEQLVAAISCGHLISGLRTKERRLTQGKKIFTALFIFECFQFIIDFFITQVSINGLFNLIVCVVPALAFAYITWSCNRIEKVLLAGSNGSIVPQL